ncbi:beta-propeller fold lactonase family protein, partial [bacterium]|nr:beta-propeller fold lactonase family protein [bacterium]
FTGIVFNESGDRFWVAGGAARGIYEFDLIDGVAVYLRKIPVQGFPAGLALSKNGKSLYTAMHMSRRMAKIKISNGKEEAGYVAHQYPYDIAVLPDESVGYVANLGVDRISAIDLKSGEELAAIPVPKNPEGLKLSPDAKRLYVACADADKVAVIDTATQQVIDEFPLSDDAEDERFRPGVMPVAVDVSPDGKRLFVTCSGYDSIDVLDAATGERLGRIPTGWYPTNVAISPDGETLYVANGKGVGSAGYLHDVRWPGVLQEVEIPDAAELSDYTDQVESNVRWATNLYADWYGSELDSPIPTEYGRRSAQIRHVIFILKENKTYDQVFGDLEGTEADPGYLVFGEDVTPNHHRLAREFVNMDNFYVEGDISVMGHMWAMYMNNNDHMEKAFLAGGKYPIPDLDVSTRPANQNIFREVLDAGLEFRNYGQLVGITDDIDFYAPYTNLHYGFWNMGTSDEHRKSVEIIREWEQGLFPDLIYIILPNDHTYGGSAGAPTANWQVGDNDAALGKLVDWVSHSKYWDETAIFITEDDPQSGWDHIDPHRTISMVVSPWAKRNHLSSVFYTHASIWNTIHLILGLPPRTKFDEFAAPMFDAFTMDKDDTPYDYVTNPTPFEITGEDKVSQYLCGTPNFLVPDGAPGMARALWALYKPGKPFPVAASVDACADEEDEDEEEDGDGGEPSDRE